jgi:cation transport ATPase
MADLTSRDDERAAEEARKKGQEEEKRKQQELEKAKEQARVKGQEEEKQKQQELEKAKEQARKEGLEQERAREKAKGRGNGVKIILGVILLVIILIAAAFLTLNVTVSNVAPGLAMPFTTNYGVSFPEGQTITIGNTHIIVLSNQGLIITDIDGDKQNMVVGEDRIISERRAVITTLGAITLMDTNFQINLKYKGERDNRAYFDMAVHTSKQVPDILLKQLLPNEIDARPI